MLKSRKCLVLSKIMLTFAVVNQKLNHLIHSDYEQNDYYRPSYQRPRK